MLKLDYRKCQSFDMSKFVTVPAIIPDIQATFKNLPEGGARIIFELSPDHAPLYYSWMVCNRVQNEANLELTVKVL